MFKQELMTPQAIEHEMSFLHQLLYDVEGTESFVRAHELIDMNRYKIISKPVALRKAIRQTKNKPFVFWNNKN